MRHRRAGRKFNRDTKSRKSLYRALATALVVRGTVVTTSAKGKTLRGLADRLVTIAKNDDQLHARRELQNFFGKRDVANVLVDRIVPINGERTSGYTTLSAVGNRAGDNAPMVEVKWIVMPEIVDTLKNQNPAPKNERKSKKTTKTARVAKVAKTEAAPKKAVAKKPVKNSAKPKAA